MRGVEGMRRSSKVGTPTLNSSDGLRPMQCREDYSMEIENHLLSLKSKSNA